jgi:glycerol-3-phosphate dehydrogenase subunit C
MIETPRKVLGSVAELVEYKEHGREAACCGAPAGVKPLYPEIANKLAETLMDEASSKGVTEVGVGCAFCMYHMKGALRGPEDPRTIRTLSQLVLANIEDGT